MQAKTGVSYSYYMYSVLTNFSFQRCNLVIHCIELLGSLFHRCQLILDPSDLSFRGIHLPMGLLQITLKLLGEGGGKKEKKRERERDYAREEENNVPTSSTFVFCFDRCISSALYTLQSLTYKSQKPIQINCHTAYYILQRLRGNS